MSFFSFPPPTTCEFCDTTQNGICLRPACMAARLSRVQPAPQEKASVKQPQRNPCPSVDLSEALLQTPPFPSGYASKREEERGNISIRVYKNGVQVGIIEAALKRDHQYPYYEASRLYVEKGHRHVGIGRALVQVLLAECQGVEVCGVAQSFGSDPIGKKRLVQFYRRCGAQVSRSGTVTWQPHCASVDVKGEAI